MGGWGGWGGWWEAHVVPRLVEASLSDERVRRHRALACDGLAGRVLELGYGSGLNAGLYPAEVEAVDAVEPSDVAWRRSGPRRRTGPPVARVGLDGQRLDAADDAYDAVLSTFTLCTIPDATLALAEVRRVLRPGGRLHVLEHGLAPDPGVVRWQHRLEPLEKRIAGGCHLTRDVTGLLRDAGFAVEEQETGYLSGPRAMRPWTHLTRAVAT